MENFSICKHCPVLGLQQMREYWPRPPAWNYFKNFIKAQDLFSPEKWEERPLLGKLLATSDLRDVQIVGSIPFPAMHVQAFSNFPHISGHSCLRNQCRLLDNQGHKAADDITK